MVKETGIPNNVIPIEAGRVLQAKRQIRGKRGESNKRERRLIELLMIALEVAKEVDTPMQSV